MKTATGVCKFCGQTAALEVPEEFTQEMIDEEAVRKCDCPEAQAFTKQQEMIASGEGIVKDFFKDREEMEGMKKLLLSAVELIARHEIDSVSIPRGGFKAVLKPGKNGIKLSLSHTTVDSVES